MSVFLLILKVLILNMQGFRSTDKQREVTHFLRQNRIDIAFLQETNVYTAHDVQTFQTLSIPSYFSLVSSRSCGVGVSPLIGGVQFKIMNIYAPAKTTASKEFFRAIGIYLFHSGPVIFYGDCNCVLDSCRDVRGPDQGRSTWNAAELGLLVKGIGVGGRMDYHIGE